MRVLFVLPAPVRVPMGGAAVVYRHAEGLASRGHHVTVAAPQRGGSLQALVLRTGVRLRDAFHRVPNTPLFDAVGVKTVEPRSLSELDIISGSVIATGYQTAKWVASLTRSRARSGFYFVQGDERALNARAEGTWRLPLTRIAVSQWVAGTLRDHGHPVAGVVPNAVDPDCFSLDQTFDKRPRHIVALYHRHTVKGPTVLLEALARLKQMAADVQATVISSRPPRHRLPRWVNVEVRPSASRLRTIYNSAAVCLHTSRVEGWGLVPMEAAACGCAVVATASRGPREYLNVGSSMAEVEVGDAAGLAREALHLLDNEGARVRMAEAALADVGRFSWSASTDEFERLLLAYSS